MNAPELDAARHIWVMLLRYSDLGKGGGGRVEEAEQTTVNPKRSRVEANNSFGRSLGTNKRKGLLSMISKPNKITKVLESHVLVFHGYEIGKDLKRNSGDID